MGGGWQKCPFYAVYKLFGKYSIAFINFFIFSSYIGSSLELDLLLPSGIHDLPRNIYVKML